MKDRSRDTETGHKPRDRLRSTKITQRFRDVPARSPKHRSPKSPARGGGARGEARGACCRRLCARPVRVRWGRKKRPDRLRAAARAERGVARAAAAGRGGACGGRRSVGRASRRWSARGGARGRPAPAPLAHSRARTLGVCGRATTHGAGGGRGGHRRACAGGGRRGIWFDGIGGERSASGRGAA